MQVRSNAAGTISKGAGNKVQKKHLLVMRVLRHGSKRNNLLSDDAIAV